MKKKNIKKANWLIHETSPYLLDHASNPVDWHPWNPETIQKAKQVNKPIFLSIGYSTCHWCHVMKRESFENQEIAAILNEHFIPIKVDREERPDLDEYYMKSVQLLTGRGGWPLSVFLTPDLEPFYGGTYFPPENRYHMPGFTKVLLTLKDIWAGEKLKLEKQGHLIQKHISQMNQYQVRSSETNYNNLISSAYDQLESIFDQNYGGFGKAPKFPQPVTLQFLLLYHDVSDNGRAEQMMQHTLNHMAMGGLYDQIGGGFHRYSVDARWAVPHFEKMLYDNALLSHLYLDAYQKWQTPFYRYVAQDTFNYILREMTDSNGGFYSAQDADSNGEEGLFYTWYYEDLEKALDDNEMDFISSVFDIPQKGNWKGKIILAHTQNSDVLLGQNLQALERFEKIRKKLYAIRKNRHSLKTDKKIMVDWNSLMISAFCKGAQILGDERYQKAAEKSADFILKNMVKQDMLFHSYCQNRLSVSGFLHDYAFLTQALLDLYETTLDDRYLHHAKRFLIGTQKRFFDEKDGGYFTSSDSPDFPKNQMNPFDSAIPSGDAIALTNLIRLFPYFPDMVKKKYVEQTFKRYDQTMTKHPTATFGLITALTRFTAPPTTITLVGEKDNPRTQAIINKIRTFYIPNLSIALIHSRMSWSVKSNSSFTQLEKPDPTQSCVHICKNHACFDPVYEPKQLDSLFVRQTSP